MRDLDMIVGFDLTTLDISEPGILIITQDANRVELYLTEGAISLIEKAIAEQRARRGTR